jgi:copper chaperone NosL
MSAINQKIKMMGLMKVLTILSSLLMFTVIFFPIWRIELTAPQYPEGLVLEIWTNKLAGNVDIINGLNHYIGMRKLHAEDFLEFTVLPYIIIGFAVLGLAVLIVNKKSIYNAWFYLFILISIVSMIDFYRWEYDYGHELNPDAPIKVPGMAYQPPLLGYKKLLNFGAYSVPDIGGWFFIGAGILLLLGWLIGRKQKAML